jgi:hypothetical protein
MALSHFDDKQHPPTDDDVAQALGKVYAQWTRLRDRIAQDHAPLVAEWGFAGKAYGWGLRLKQPKRTVLYMTPCAGHFLASMALGEKAVAAAHAAGLPQGVLEVVDGARKYAEGRAVRLPVRTARDVANVQRLVAIRMAT